MRLTYILRDNGACGYYRISLPLGRLAAKGWTVYAIEKGDTASHIERGMDTDLLVIARPSEPQMLDLIREMQARGTRVVIDYDDDMFHISPLSPHYAEFGTHEVAARLPNGEQVTVWQDGVASFSLAANRQRLDLIKRCVEQADLVTVTTERLADCYRPYTDRVAVLPNCVDLTVWKRLPLQPRAGLRLGWHGGSSHYEDWCLLTQGLPEVMAAYPDLTLVIFGTKFDGTLKAIPADRIEFHRWVPTPAFPYKLAALDLDVAMIPLAETAFNTCKSPIKWVEYAALEVPAVTSHVSPYREIATEKNGVFIEANAPDAWVRGLCLLVEDAMARAAIGYAARQTVEASFDIDRECSRWDEVYRRVLTTTGVA